jgi:NADH-quinone oxidoreductase subunit A
MSSLAAYLLLFLAVGAAFILVNLLVGKLVRPARPEAEKGTIYECGEPTIGSSWVQFDVRFYVVALLFVIFDVEVAFFFPWAEVFGKYCAVAGMSQPKTDAEWQAYQANAQPLVPPYPQNEAALKHYNGAVPENDEQKKQYERRFETDQRTARGVAWLAFWEIFVFFGVLLVGFAYLWRRGDLAWVRSLSDRQVAVPGPAPVPPPAPVAAGKELVGTGSPTAVP